MPLLDNCKVTTEAPTATGTTTINSAAYDMTGYDGITFIVRLGSPAANNSIKVNQCATSGGSYNDLAGTSVGGATNNSKAVTIHRPGKQFIKCSVVRGTTTTIDSLVVLQWKGKGVRPVTQANLDYEEWNSPAEGTA
jgi:hypothetical protein